MNPEDKRRIIGDTFVKVADQTANDLNLTWENLLLGQGNLDFCVYVYCGKTIS